MSEVFAIVAHVPIFSESYIAYILFFFNTSKVRSLYKSHVGHEHGTCRKLYNVGKSMT